MSEKDNNEKEKKIKKLSEVSAENESNDKTFDKIVSMEKPAKKEEKLTTLQDVIIEVDESRKKVKLDELVKKSDSEEKQGKEKESTIVAVDFKKESKKKKDQEAKADKEKTKQVKKDLKELGGLKDEKAEAKKEEHKDKNDNYEINLDTLGVERAKEPIDVEKIIITAIIVIGSVFLLAVLLYFLPIFRIKEVNVSGLNIVEKEEVEKAIGFDKEQNVFVLLMSGIKDKVLTIPEIKSVDYKLEGLRILNIKVNEIRVAGYIPYLNEYVYIDSEGKVVDISDVKEDGIPLIEGLDFTSFSLGKLLDVSNDDSLKMIIEITNVLNKYDISSQIDSIDVTDSENISLFVGSIEVGIGTIEECDHKIRMALEAIKNLQGAKGFLDVTSSKDKIYFKPIA